MIGFVTDSTAYLPAKYIADNGIVVVPVQVIIDGQSFDEVGELSVQTVVDKLANGSSVTTSRPAPDQFADAYQSLIDAGCTQIVSVHLSSELSGTYESALMAKSRFDIPIEVIDSRGIAMMMGFAVESGIEAARRGESFTNVVDVVVSRCAESTIHFYVDTLEFLKKGGRISPLQSRIGGALSVKPLLHMNQGKVEQAELVRTSVKALARLMELTEEAAAKGECDIAVHHVAADVRAENVAMQIRTALGKADVPVTECGAVVAAHVGPGAVAVVVSPRP